MADLVLFFENLGPPGNTSGLVLFAKIAAIFDLLEVESISNMKWKANETPEGALAFNFLSGILIFYEGAPARFPPSGNVQNDDKCDLA